MSGTNKAPADGVRVDANVIAGVGLDSLRQAKAQTEQFQYAGFLFEDTDHVVGK